MAKIELIQFSDGNYAIRKKAFWCKPEYLDLKTSPYYWSITSKYFKDCLTNNLEEIKSIYCRLSIPPKVIKCNCK